MSMTWGEFVKKMEKNGVKSSTEIGIEILIMPTFDLYLKQTNGIVYIKQNQKG